MVIGWAPWWTGQTERTTFLTVGEAAGGLADGVIALQGQWLGANTFVSLNRRAVAPLRKHGVGHAGGHLVTSVFPPWHPSPPGAWLGSPFLFPMALVPRWRYMTDEAKALARRSAVSAAVVLVALLLFRGLLPWVALGLAAWWIWKAINR